MSCCGCNTGPHGILQKRWSRLEGLLAAAADRRGRNAPTLPQLADRINYIAEPSSAGHGKLAIINSSNTTNDSRVSNRLLCEDGAPEALMAPENMLCVAGNIMSRGVTVEGLTVTFYGRDSQIPLGDASLQHARWMGHKGEDEVGPGFCIHVPVDTSQSVAACKLAVQA